MDAKYLDFICTKDTFRSTDDAAVVPFDAYADYELLTTFYDSCPECQSFPKEEYFSGDWYKDWEDYVIWQDGQIAARAAIWKCTADKWEVAGVITHPAYRRRGYAARVVAHCVARILRKEKVAFLSTAETNAPMIAVAGKVGFILQE